ncbi:FUSC family protein [Oceanobacillus piezotolerans]|nr:FUSC family protein [Oceanobacillus piezotolerans]
MSQRNKGKSSVFRQAFSLNRKPIPWLKAFNAGLAASIPVIIGLLLGNFRFGLIAGLGGFTFLYVFNVPYAQRAKKICWVVLAMTLITFLGTVAAPYPLAVAVLMGLIGATAIFVFGALKIAGPSAIFFVLVFLMVSGMPIDPDEAFIRAGLVFLGGSLSWIIAMAGWFHDPHGPERSVVQRVYMELAAFVESVGTEDFNESRHRMMSALTEADETLAAGYIPWRETNIFKRLYVLNKHANSMFLYIIHHYADRNTTPLPEELVQSIKTISYSLDKKQLKNISKNILQPSEMEKDVQHLFEMIYNADAVMNEPTAKIEEKIQINRPSVKTILAGALDKNSIVFITSLRFGVVTTLAAIFAFEMELARSYWVPLSSVAVMSGATIVATYHRAIQRGIGTMIGIIIASIILSINPSGYTVAFFILMLTFITELFIVKNYGLAALFFTPSALLMAESTTQGAFSFSYFASARMLDVVIGIIIGLIGVWLIGRKSASSRLPHLVSKTIRSQGQFLVSLFSQQEKELDAEDSHELKKMRTNIINLKTLYSTAAGEIPIDEKAVEYYWPVLRSIEHLGYLLENISKIKKRPILEDDTLAKLLYNCESMAMAAERGIAPNTKDIPEIPSYHSIQEEIIQLQRVLQNT